MEAKKRMQDVLKVGDTITFDVRFGWHYDVVDVKGSSVLIRKFEKDKKGIKHYKGDAESLTEFDKLEYIKLL